MVYDVTQFLPIHPGTEDLISQYGGMDADVGFDMFHEESILKQHLVPCDLRGSPSRIRRREFAQSRHARDSSAYGGEG